MPTYEYQCKSCKAVYELRQGFDAETTHKCEECGKGTAKRILSTPAVVFKGGGWYATDSREKASSSSKADSAGETKGDAKTESSSSDSSTPAATSTEKKPAAKTESKPGASSTSSESAAS